MNIKTESQKNIIDIFIRIIILSLLLFVSYLIVKPFLLIIVWSVLLAVTLYPLYNKLLDLFKGKRKKLVTTLFVLVLLSLLITPAIRLTSQVIDTSTNLIGNVNSGDLNIPPPDQKIKNVPLIGEKIYTMWQSASSNLEKFILSNKEPIKDFLSSIFAKIGGLMGTVFLALISLIIAGIFMASAETGYVATVKLGNRLMPGKGDELVKMIVDTIRSVVKGILLVGIIQSLLAYIGFAIAGLNGAAFYAFLVMIFAIIQVPPLLAMIPPIAIYASTTDSTTAIVIFTVYSIIVSMSDNILKPMLLGKGLQTPMLVILIGAIGGMFLMGILGLFIGPVILAIAYQLYINWVSETVES